MSPDEQPHSHPDDPSDPLEDAEERRVVIHYEDDTDALRDAQGINIRQGSSLTKSLLIKGNLILKIRQNETTTITLLTN